VTAVQDRVAEFLEGGRRNRRDIATPEGVMLPVEIASVGERVVASSSTSSSGSAQA